MQTKSMSLTRETKETNITIDLDLDTPGTPGIGTTVPFFDHMLNAMAFHGGFSLSVKASGDTESDPHHLVEDTGIIFGRLLKEWARTYGPLVRFGHAVIPMDEALSEVTIDVSGRSHLVYRADYPQQRCGDFDTALIREFLLGLTRTAEITLHAQVRHGDNSHHMTESLFKALGKALAQAYCRSNAGGIPSTKGTIE